MYLNPAFVMALVGAISFTAGWLLRSITEPNPKNRNEETLADKLKRKRKK